MAIKKKVLSLSMLKIDQLNAWHSQDHGLTPSYLTKTCTGLHFYDSVLVIEKYPNHYKPKTSMTGKFSF